jgi:hypothetical protein
MNRVGDLVWGKQHGFPWWPCIVTYDPDHGVFTKQDIDKKSAARKQTIHVQFLGHEKPARAWLNSAALQPWAETKEEHLKQKIKERLAPDWKRALEDCEESLGLTRPQRIGRHATVFGRADSDDEDEPERQSETQKCREPDAEERGAPAAAAAASPQPQKERDEEREKFKWTKGMDAKLMKLILLHATEHGKVKRWTELTKRMGGGFTVKQVQNHWRGLKEAYENGRFEKMIKEYTANALAEGIDLDEIAAAPAATSHTSATHECQICSDGAGTTLACVGGCGRYFHRACIGLARTPKAFACDLCSINKASAQPRPGQATPGNIDAESRHKHAPEQDPRAEDEEPQDGDEDDDNDDDELCVVCSSGADSARMLLCDGCDDGYHLRCLKPKMDRIPTGSWFCPTCRAQPRNGAQYCEQTVRYGRHIPFPMHLLILN